LRGGDNHAATAYQRPLLQGRVGKLG
jgi:hypothetical protein